MLCQERPWDKTKGRQTCLHSYVNIKIVVFLQKLEYFQLLATGQGQCFLLMSFLLPWATEKSEQQYW